MSDNPRPPAATRPQQKRPPGRLLVGIVLVTLFSVGIPLTVNLITDFQWFHSVGFESVFTREAGYRVALFALFGAVAAAVIGASGWWTWKSRPNVLDGLEESSPIAVYRAAIEQSWKKILLSMPLAAFVGGGLVGQDSWTTVALALHGQTFGHSDPQFGMDYGFYAFTLPLLHVIVSFLSIVLVIAFLLALAGHYLLGSIRPGSVGQGTKGTMSSGARVQLAVTAGVWMLVKVASYWLDRFDLLSRTHDLTLNRASFTGGNYTDIHAVLPAKILLMIIGVVVAFAFFATVVLKDLRIPALATTLMVLSAGIIGVAWPMAVNQFTVIPNRAEKESKYIGRNIDATRYAYGLTDDHVVYDNNWGASGASNEAVAADSATLSNIRLLDPQILADTFTQREQLKNFYGFPKKLNIDRYTVDGKLRDYVVAAREIDPTALTDNQKDWINRHTVYTHGNGLVAAPANKVDEVARDVGSARGGYPVFVVSDLQTQQREGGNAAADKVGIEVTQPRIYYGPVIASGPEQQDYVIVGGTPGGKSLEYDTDSETYTYTGRGGVSVGNIINRGLYAARYKELNMLLSDRIDDKSKIIFNRDPRKRVEKVAPWLTTDSETYPTVIDGKIKWIVDGYTTLSNLPYANTTQLASATKDALDPSGNTQLTFSPRIGYIRNSVKAVVDAYDGSVDLYAFDESDPVLSAWEGVFPGVVKPKSDISPELMKHLRYPSDLFKVQREMIAKYHVSNPREFFTSDKFWSVPSDPTSEGQSKFAQPPYYIVASDPESKKASFQLITPFRGFQREFLAAHMTVSSDPDTYGRITVRVLPTDTQTFGPAQAQDVMTSSDQIARDRTLWQATNDITNGNLLTLPVGGGEILYVEPIYTKRKNQESAFPKLLRVLVYYKGSVGYAPTIAEALSQVGIDPRSAADLVEAEKADGKLDPVANPPKAKGDKQTGAVGEENKSAQPQPAPANALPVPQGTPKDTAQAVQRINDALKALDRAKNDSHEAYGKALDELDKAVADYRKVTGATQPAQPGVTTQPDGAAKPAQPGVTTQ